MFFQFVFAIAQVFTTIRLVPQQNGGLTVDTAEGDVVGTLVSPTVRQFLGIPYAVANRWEPPRSAPARSILFNASNFGDSCPQFIPASSQAIQGPVVNVSESEDCLSLNIWSPTTERKQRTAVMIWIYGGGFQFGTSNTDEYNGQYFVRNHDDVLVVSFNYRTNIFGQPGAPQLSTNATQTQNFGLLDVNAAVQWVHKNIAAFGGDPERIILFGQSAGAITTDAYSYMHPNDTIVKGIIQQSGNLRITGAMATLDPTSWNLASNVVGCGAVIDAAQFDCMKKVPYQKLEDAVRSNQDDFSPMIDNITIFSDFDARAAAGNFLQVPVLAGSNQNEGDSAIVGQQLVSLGFTMPVLTEMMSDIRTQLEFTCATSRTVEDRVGAGLPVWRYQYQGVFRDISRLPDIRSTHASEIPLVFGVVSNVSTDPTIPPSTPDELALSKYMQSAWVAFARDPANGLLDFGWPLYDPNPTSNASTLVQLGGFYNLTGETLAQGRLLDFTCGSQDVLSGMMKPLEVFLTNASIFKSS